MNTITHPLDVVVVGAGPAGIGVAIALMDAGIESLLVLERDYVGSSFAQWPKETRFITPSFPSNSIGMLDLNSIAIGISHVCMTVNPDPHVNCEIIISEGPIYIFHFQSIIRPIKITTSLTMLEEGIILLHPSRWSHTPIVR